MDGIIRRRNIAPNAVAGGNAITALTENDYITPILMPKNSKVIIDCHLDLKDFDGQNYAKFFWFGANKTQICRGTGWFVWYYVNTNDWTSRIDVDPSQIIETIQLEPDSGTGTFTLYFDDGTIGTASRGNWAYRSNNLQMNLRPNLYVKRIRQINEGDVLVHDITPVIQNGVVGMYDAVDGEFYGYPDTDAYIVTI